MVMPPGIEPGISTLKGWRVEPIPLWHDMVIPVGFEPNIAGLRVRPPKPLEDGTIYAFQ